MRPIRCCCRCLPRAAELGEVPGFTRDAVGDLDARRAGVLHKYAGRALLIATGSCAVQLSLLLPASFSLRRGNRRREPLAERGRAHRDDASIRGDPLRRRSAVAVDCEARRA
jgi:hypothetical protein